MILMDEAHCRRVALALLLLSAIGLSANAAHAASSPMAEATTTTRTVAEAQLTADIRAIADSSTLPHSVKQKQISDRVRAALAEYISPRADPAQSTALVLRLTLAAAEAAPAYVEAIANAVTFSPVSKKLDLPPARVRAAAYAGASQQTSPAAISLATPGSTGFAAASLSGPPASSSALAGAAIDAPPGPMSTVAPKDAWGKSSAFTLSAVTGVRYDDNVFINNTDEVDETIFTFTPGVDYSFGQRSLVQGSIGYKAAFTHYANGSADDTVLSSGNANVGYEAGSISMTGAASYQQLQQNTSEVAILNPTSLIRQNILSANGNVEGRITDRLNFQTGMNYSELEYKTRNLIGNRTMSWPVKLNFETSPRLNLSTGVTYGTTELDNNGPSSHDTYYNVGMRGSFTRDLSGQFSVGYRNREVGDAPSESLWGFDGSFNYDFSPKTNFALLFSRDFSAGAQGESLTNSSYSLRASFDPVPQWQFGANLSYRSVQYGAIVFLSPELTRESLDREDDYWETSFVATYLFNRWFSTSVNAIIRHNASNFSAVEFSNRIIGLSFSFRY